MKTPTRFMTFRADKKSRPCKTKNGVLKYTQLWVGPPEFFTDPVTADVATKVAKRLGYKAIFTIS